MCKNKMRILGLMAVLCLSSYTFAQEQSGENKLLIPDGLVDGISGDITIQQTSKYQLEELRVGGRLERVTVRRNNGLTEIYQNQRNDAVWQSDEEGLGDVPNVRQWKLGGW